MLRIFISLTHTQMESDAISGYYSDIYVYTYIYIIIPVSISVIRGRRGRDLMVV